jgi:hypothetical protein
MRQDISDIISQWQYDPEANVRTVVGADGVKVLQVRVDQGALQGILQLNLDGRPDGRRPHGHEYAFDYYRALSQEQGKEGFALEAEACEELFDEGARVYGRYVFLLRLKNYDRVVRDTERNMALFRFVNTYAVRKEDRDNLEKWWPYILRIHATAHARLASIAGDFNGAVDLVRQARVKIADLKPVEAEEFFVERQKADKKLGELEEELAQLRPRSEEEMLEERLQQAVSREAFEEAASLRDRLRGLRERGD